MAHRFSRLWHTIIVFFCAMFVLSITVFTVARLAPGDPLQAFYGERIDRMSTEEQSSARLRLGLDKPLYIQYIQWVTHGLHGDFGISYKYREPAMHVMADMAGNTLLLGIASYLTVFVIAIILALICALYEDRWPDRLLSTVGTIANYIPSFWLGLLFLLLFNVNWGWLPGSGAYAPGESENLLSRANHLILPLSVMVITHVWYYAYIIRNKLLDETRADYVLLAKAKGLSRRTILIRHCLRNVLPTIISVIAVSANHIVGGTYVVEAVFSYPGLGTLAIESAKYHDYNLLMLIVMLTGCFVIASGLAAQAINEQLDSRLQHDEGQVI